MRASALDVELETWLVVKQPPESSTSEMLHEIEFTNYGGDEAWVEVSSRPSKPDECYYVEHDDHWHIEHVYLKPTPRIGKRTKSKHSESVDVKNPTTTATLDISGGTTSSPYQSSPVILVKFDPVIHIPVRH
jgi:hypothetical protein